MEELEFIHGELEGAGIKIGRIVQADFDSFGTVKPPPMTDVLRNDPSEARKLTKST